MRPLCAMLVGSLLLLSACATIGNESLKTASLEQIQGMSKADLIERYGAPQAQSLVIIGGRHLETLTWSYGHAETNPMLYVPIIGLFVAASGQGITAESASLTVSFDEQGKAMRMAQGRGGYGGLAAATKQPLTPGIND